MTMHGETMIANYKIIDDGIWLSYDELKRMYAAKIEELKGNDGYSHICSRIIGQMYLIESMMGRVENALEMLKKNNKHPRSVR